MDISFENDRVKSLLKVETSQSGEGSSLAGQSSAPDTGEEHDRMIPFDGTNRSLHELASQELGEDDVRVEYVAAIRSAWATGAYNIPPSAVATKLVDSKLSEYK